MYYCTGEEKASVILSSQKAEEDHFRKSFHSFCEKNGSHAKKNWMLGKAQKILSVEKVHLWGYWWCVLRRALAGAVLGSCGHPSSWTERARSSSVPFS